MVEIKSQAGEIIASVDDWFRYAPPAGKKKHWVDGRSAKELAKTWIRTGVPEEFARLIETHEVTRGFAIEIAIPEMKIKFDEVPRGPRNADLQLVGMTPNGRLSISIEGKADESFGESTVGEYRENALKDDEPTNVPERIEGLCQALFGTSYGEQLADFRYQLFHATAATIVQAERDKAEQALFLVHEFVSSLTKKENLERNDRDFREFFAALGAIEAASLDPDKIHGPFRVPGGGLVSGELDLYVAKISVTV